MSTVGVRKKRRKCLNRKESRGNDKATHCSASCFMKELFRVDARISRNLQVPWKCLNIVILHPLKDSYKPLIQWCFTEIVVSSPPVIWQCVGLCLVLGRGSLLPALLLQEAWLVCAMQWVYRTLLLIKTCPAQGPVGLPLKNTAVLPKMLFCFVLLFPQVWLPAVHFFYLCMVCPNPSYSLCFGYLWLPKVQWSRRLKVLVVWTL